MDQEPKRKKSNLKSGKSREKKEVTLVVPQRESSSSSESSSIAFGELTVNPNDNNSAADFAGEINGEINHT